MSAVVGRYLDSVRASLRLDSPSEKEVIGELETHIEERLDELKAAGLSEEEAVSKCLRLMGSARMVGHQLYEAYSQGSWRQTLLASLPHLLFAMLFAFNWWPGTGWVVIMLSLVMVTAVCGWFHGMPAWLFPWLGYSLLPVAVAGLFLLCLPTGWAWLAILIYIPFALWLLLSITINVENVRRDWLYNSLMVLPVPVIMGWILSTWSGEFFPDYGPRYVPDFAPWISLSFLTLALAVAIFIRLRQRGFKIAILLISGLAALMILALFSQGRLTLVAFLLLALLTVGLFLAPAVVERRIRYHRVVPK